MAKKKQNRFSDSIRQAVLASKLTRYRISKELGISESTLSRFVHGTQWLGEDYMDKLAALLEIEITTRKG